MNDGLSTVLKIKDSVDIYIFKDVDDGIKIQFYKINTRVKKTIRTTDAVAKILALIDGKKTIGNIFEILKIQDDGSILLLVDFLVKNGITTISNEPYNNKFSRFSRQISFFDDWFNDISGAAAQENLSNKHVTIIGVGAVGGLIAEQLVRAGVLNLTIIDNKFNSNSNKSRHYFFNANKAGKYKVDSLKEHLERIDPASKIQIKCTKVIPSTDLNELINDSTSLVVNTADEPYIGHITIKLSRHLWVRNIALYVAGGFDAHLSSTGDFYIPNRTPCAECCSNSFKEALKGWTPTYIQHKRNDDKLITPDNFNGGLAAQSLFSASYASTKIIRYLASGYHEKQTTSVRGEYLINKGKIAWFEITKKDGCEYCGE